MYIFCPTVYLLLQMFYSCSEVYQSYENGFVCLLMTAQT